MEWREKGTGRKRKATGKKNGGGGALKVVGLLDPRLGTESTMGVAPGLHCASHQGGSPNGQGAFLRPAPGEPAWRGRD